jgi:sugar-phosphatase
MMMALPSVLENVEGILFDNEGTLIDASEASRICWGTFAEWYGLPADELLAFMPGRPARDVIGHYAQRLAVPVDDALDRYLEYATDSVAGIRPIPGASELLAAIPRNRWAVVTSGTREFALRRISAAGLPEPENLITADDVSAGKPDPEPYIAAARKLGVNPSKSLAIDDAPAGIESATRAGCLTVGLLTTHSKSELPPAGNYAKDLTQIEATQRGGMIRVAILG